MPSIKESMNEVYKVQYFTEEMQQKTIARLKKGNERRSLQWKPAFASVAIVMIILVLALTSAKQEPIETNSTMAPNDADVALVERFKEFQQIITDGVVTDAERRQYISRSDWDLQLAFESGESIFYNRPTMDKKQIEAATHLLHNMYRIVYERRPIEKLPTFTESANFQNIVSFSPSFNEQAENLIKKQYSSSLEEKPLTKNDFLNLDWWWQLLIVSLFGLFVYLFVQNIRIDHKKFAGVLQIIFIVLIGSIFFVKDKTFYSYDETALMESAQAHIMELYPNGKVQELLSVAQFNEGRLALFKLQDEQLMLMKYYEYEGKYKFGGSSIGNDLMTESFLLNDYYEGQQIAIVNDAKNISAISMTDTELQEEYKIDILANTKIYLFTRPEQSQSVYINWYDANGEVIEEK